MLPNRYCGITESAHAARGVTLCTTAYAGNATVPVHEHPNPYVCINLAGTFQEYSGGKEHVVRAHDLVYHPSGHRHADLFPADGGHCLNLEMPPGEMPSSSWSEPPEAEPIYANDPELRRIGRALIREAHLQETGTSPLAIEELLTTLFARFSGPTRRRHDRPARWLLAVRDELRSTCSETHRLNTLAAMAGVHPVHLAREFRRQFGCPVHVYLLRCRIEAATAKLTNGDQPLVDIALELGFCSQSHFSRVFGAATGMAPGTYRSRMKGTKR